MKILTAKEASKYRENGADEIPTQWIEADKSEKLRADANPLPVKAKSRLVARGDLQKQYGRTDSPTVDDEGAYSVVIYCASKALPQVAVALIMDNFKERSLRRRCF